MWKETFNRISSVVCLVVLLTPFYSAMSVNALTKTKYGVNIAAGRLQPRTPQNQRYSLLDTEKSKILEIELGALVALEYTYGISNVQADILKKLIDRYQVNVTSEGYQRIQDGLNQILTWRYEQDHHPKNDIIFLKKLDIKFRTNLAQEILPKCLHLREDIKKPYGEEVLDDCIVEEVKNRGVKKIPKLWREKISTRYDEGRSIRDTQRQELQQIVQVISKGRTIKEREQHRS